MAITLDQVLGSASANATTSVHITTGATAAAGSRIVVCVSFFQPTPGTLAVSDGTAYTLDKTFNNGSDHFLIYSRVLVGSLTSGSSITFTDSSSTGLGGVLLAACSYLGTTATDTSSSNATTGTGFSSGAATNAVADALFVGGAGNETATTSVGGTNTNGTSRADIWNATAGQGMRMLDKIASSIGSQALTGTWASSSTATSGGLMIYSGTAGATSIPDLIMAPAHR